MARKPKCSAAANEGGKGFAQIPRVMLESHAYRSIRTLAAAKMLPVFCAKWGAAQALTGKPVCEFHYSEAINIHGIPRSSCSRGLKELHALGFFDVLEKGGEWKGNGWTPTIYRKSDRWRKYGKPEFLSLSWTPSEPSTRPKPPKPRSRRLNDSKLSVPNNGVCAG